MEKETRKPIEIVCPHCGKTTAVLCCVKFSGCKDGFLYDPDDIDVEVFNVHYDYIVWEFFCYACRNELEEEEIEELMNDTNHIPLSVQLQIESEIDIFEDFWKKDQAQEGENK